MNFRVWLESPRTRLDITAGMVDGVLSALTLAAGRLLKPGAALSVDLAVRVGAATALTTLFVFFVAHYAELRAELVRAERQLNLLSHGKLAGGRLGLRAIEEAAAGSVVAALCGFVGAMIPLLLCLSCPGPRWVGIAATILLLGLLGALLARSIHGAAPLWSVAIMLGGIVLTFVGVSLDIVP
jgi:predicted membrane protein (TIGR00267 family)